jgi:hypothetical protein
LIDEAKSWFRRWFAKVWKLRGGGLYAVGYALTFVYLEVRMILGEFIEADSVVDFFTSQLFEFLFRFMVDSIENMIQAFIWPVYIVTWQQPIGAIALGVAYIVFAKFIKHHITAWLFPDGEEAETPLQRRL